MRRQIGLRVLLASRYAGHQTSAHLIYRQRLTNTFIEPLTVLLTAAAEPGGSHAASATDTSANKPFEGVFLTS